LLPSTPHVLLCTVQTVNVYNNRLIINFILVHKSSRIAGCCIVIVDDDVPYILVLSCPFRHLIKRKITIIAYEYVVVYGVYTERLINAASPTSSLYHVDSKRAFELSRK
jgi:hypothetical protein